MPRCSASQPSHVGVLLELRGDCDFPRGGLEHRLAFLQRRSRQGATASLLERYPAGHLLAYAVPQRLPLIQAHVSRFRCFAVSVATKQCIPNN
jgi:hypothetical protein